MKLVVDGVGYEIVESLNGAGLGDLRTAKKELGVTVRSIKSTFDRLGEEAQAREDAGLEYDNLALLEDDDFLLSMIGLIWLSKRKAGESITIAEAEATPFDTFQLDFDDEDEAVAEVPKGEAVELTDLSE